MLTVLTALLALTSAVALADAQDGEGKVADRLAALIVQKHYRRVGVAPRFIARKAGGQAALGGTIGPQAERYAEYLEDALAARAGDSYQVVAGRVLKKAFDGLRLDDLGDRDTLAKVAERAQGLDALVVGTVVDERDADADGDGRFGGLRVRCELVSVRDGALAGSAREGIDPTLVDSAYMGESWELRRWTARGLEPSGLTLQVDDGVAVSPFGLGPVYERHQYRQIQRNRPHPLLDASFPYAFEIRVAREVRKPVKVGNDLYVTLEPGESYSVYIKNNAPRPVYLAVFVDGINIRGKKRELPDPLVCRPWILEPKKDGAFRGWITGEGNNLTLEPFLIEPADATVAVGQGFSQNLGIITGVFYTVGMRDIPQAPELRSANVGGIFGTGASEKREDVHVDTKAADRPGLILAAVSLHYLPASRLGEVQAAMARTE
jgi:hypothetical protein